jgi:putative membrane protein
MLDFSANFPGFGTPGFFWAGGMWVFPLGMLVMMLVMAFLVCGRGARRSCGHAAWGARGGAPREEPREILERRYANGEVTKEEFERIKNDLRGGSSL